MLWRDQGYSSLSGLRIPALLTRTVMATIASVAADIIVIMLRSYCCCNLNY